MSLLPDFIGRLFVGSVSEVRLEDSGQDFFDRFCFVHINKCGGTSVEKALGIHVKNHDTALQHRERVGMVAWENMFTFSVVRHPYDKVCSHYRYRVKTNQTGLADGHLSLDDWVKEAYGNKNPQYYENPLMFAPCSTWLEDDKGEVIVDFVAKLEDIERDWCYIQGRLGVNTPLGVENSTANTVRSNELSQNSKIILKKHFHKDFLLFGYSDK